MVKGKSEHIKSWKLITFEDAHIQGSGDSFYSSLIVDGISPYLNLEVDLIPLVYSKTPEYWGIEVVGCLRKYALPGILPFEKVLTLDFPIGTKGIEIIGANGQVERIDCSFEVRFNPDGGDKVLIVSDRQISIKNKKDTDGDKK
ncbi:hypothetical protein [Cyclobacterium sp. SYSU L10401]|uniref:hypothetical protein n=1 Tax=Cyclobacterium sp. SYSU L10401 TaxID=2678657 RepID=UPI0013D39FBB|nr:hypothetical protein [Cyclobacterium sp. SYSU L10401]